VGSDAQYGFVPRALLPTDEDAPMKPTGVYGRSKILQEQLALAYWKMADLQVVCVRPFNHIGPGQPERFVVASIARQIALVEAGQMPATIEVGNISSARDFTDVRDVVRAYVLCATRLQPGMCVNVGTGTARAICDVVHKLLSIARVPVSLHVDASRCRTDEVNVTQCNSARIRNYTGWSPQISIDQTLTDTLEYWRHVTRTDGREPVSFNHYRIT
jgi:GDP-4-dehydro-6-deoxy-D-mannose reductase